MRGKKNFLCLLSTPHPNPLPWGEGISVILHSMYFIWLALLLPIAHAQSPYIDGPFESEIEHAVSVLTERGIVKGYSDRTFRPEHLVNRAEFVKIMMQFSASSVDNMSGDCFPDVSSGEWYAKFVCAAKLQGIIRGNALLGTPQDQWPFSPGNPVNYAEAVKMFMEFFDIPVRAMEPKEWYEGYLAAAKDYDLVLSEVHPGDALTRGQVSILTVKFLEFVGGEPEIQSSRSSRSASSWSSTDSSSSASIPVSSSQSIHSSIAHDLLSDTDVRSQFILLGDVSPIIGAARVFPEHEPLDISEITVRLTGAVPTVQSFLIYESVGGRFLGEAFLDTSSMDERQYTLFLKSGELVLPQREEFGFYARARARRFSDGGMSGESVQISALRVKGDGVWSNDGYAESTTTGFVEFETARSLLKEITNIALAQGILVPGTRQLLGSFRFWGKIGDGSANPRLTDLTFQVGNVSDVTLSNVVLRRQGTGTDISCTVSSNMATCASIAESLGSFRSGHIIFDAYGDIALASGSKNGFLQMTLNDPGTPSSAGAITWTDGTTIFSWVPFDQPVVRGTYLEY